MPYRPLRDTSRSSNGADAAALALLCLSACGAQRPRLCTPVVGPILSRVRRADAAAVAPPCSALLFRRSTVTPGPPSSGPCPVVHSYCGPRPLSPLRLAQPCEPGAISAGRRFGPQHDAAVQINLDVLSFGLATQVIRTGHRPSTASSLPFLMAATPFPSCIRCCCCAADSPNQRHSPALQT